MTDQHGTGPDPVMAIAAAVIFVVLLYLVCLNQLFLSTPDEVRKAASHTRWTDNVLRETYARLEAHPVTTKSYAARIPPKLERRYIVTGGSGEFHSPCSIRHIIPGL